MASLLQIAAVAVATSASPADGALPPQATPQLIAMTQIVVPIIGSDQIEGALHLKMVLAAPDAARLARLTARLPELRAVAIASAIEFSRLYASTQTPVNVAQLSAMLTSALRSKNPDVAEVLIVEISAAE
ncbi:hypothetical protein U1839_06880 [Sphingomonas sp. RT2P30]|uniref:hypothetical protein n=1 Tax=Parasphingomonas halimpatiens TaxID=3096162 RepID=UPI002FCBBBDC